MWRGWGSGGREAGGGTRGLSEIQAGSEHHNGTMAFAHFTRKKVLFLKLQGEDATAGNLGRPRPQFHLGVAQGQVSL